METRLVRVRELKNYVGQHRLFFPVSLVILAAIIGLFHITPQLFIRSAVEQSGGTYLWLQVPNFSDETILYVPRAREVADGHVPPGDLQVENNKGKPTVFPAVPPLLMGGLIRIFAFDVNAAYLFVNVVSPALIFLLLYALGRTVFTNRSWAILLGTIGALTPLYVRIPRAFDSLETFSNIVLKNFFPYINTYLDRTFLTRIDDPLLTVPFFLLAMYLLLRLWLRPSRNRAIAAGAAVGFLAYVYFHYWVFAVVLMGLLLMFTAAKRRDAFKWLLLGACIASLLSVPYLLNYIAFSHLPTAAEVSSRLGIEHGRAFRFMSVWRDYLVYLGAAAAVFWLVPKKEFHFRQFSFVALATMFVVWNLQLVTGFVPDPDHFERPNNILLLLITFAALFFGLQRLLTWYSREHVKRILVALAAVLVILLLVKQVINTAGFVHPTPAIIEKYSFSQDVLDSWRWVDNNVPRETVVLSPSFITTHFLMSYTASNPYLLTGLNSIASNREIEDHFTTAYKLFDVDRSAVAALLHGDSDFFCARGCTTYEWFNTKSLWRNLYNYSYVDQSFEAPLFQIADSRSVNRSIPEPVIQDILARYDLSRPTWSGTGAAYVYIGPWEHQLSSIDADKDTTLELVYRNPTVSIYRIR